MNKHDASYRQLFSNPAIVRGLFQGIVRAPWQDQIDWDRLEPLPADYISDRLRQRQGDIVWRLPRLDGRDVFLLLMIEHQSTIDFYMALRILTYLGLLYEALLARKLIKPGEPLPMVLPIVIYSGMPRWNAALNVSDLIGAIPQGLRRFLPQLQYLLVDEGALVASGKLPQNNLAALLFRLEHNRGLHDVEDLIQKVYNYTKADPIVRRAFASWTRYVLLPRSLPDVDMPQIDNLLEIKNMLAEHSRSWTHQWKMEGLAEGRKEGQKEGQVSMLHSQLTRKFGPLSESVQQRLETATPEDLQTWSLALLEARSLDEVFAG
ncbi:Rpn family recombination-promoting nuclease/putative transposase [Pusillimonas noertemannii]|uniref:Rpn family recombination-promoting nuclease/putative transposase n=1 Tax=Pusillimonas noertemannii TaxID=305977 RepID=UPI0002D73847|nr:Rpn family recombination-promoting nuclease/putative transposase [Pusillimonas noertemannii]